MDVSLLQSASYVAAEIGVCIAAIYYVMTLRVQQRNAKTTTETRQIQLLMQISQLAMSYEGEKRYVEYMNMQWSDYDDFENKYGSDNNPDNFALRQSFNVYFNTLGNLLKHKLVEPDLIYDQCGPDIMWSWGKYRGVYEKMREAYSNPALYAGWEYANDEMVRVAGGRKHPASFPDSFRYTDEMRRKVTSEASSAII